MDIIDFSKIDEARKILGLGEKATLKEIKNAYREKAKRYHPDSADCTSKDECGEIMKKINDAYETLMDYCENYIYSFKKESVEKDRNGYEYVNGFEDDWLLSRRNKPKTDYKKE
ncbi:MAG: hypothetical protein BWK75_02980 [Candidatus Altiarchaeales archaeon A3]|nr:MAG: hypothetical protein BWK75_02980 [Candidatus Altiarchaeales archaeon A3]